jgi:ABC-type transport system substrate-binding protein
VKHAALAAVLLVSLAPALAAGAAADTPAEQITWAVHTTLVPTYFDPAETTIITSFMVLYALHDGVVKPMPGKPLAPSLAESWSSRRCTSWPSSTASAGGWTNPASG